MKKFINAIVAIFSAIIICMLLMESEYVVIPTVILLVITTLTLHKRGLIKSK